MLAKKRTTKRSASKKVTRKVTSVRKSNVTGGVTTRTWTLFVLFLLVSVFAFYRISQGY